MSEEEISLSFRLGMAAAILASVGTFAVADDYQCGDEHCIVGTTSPVRAGYIKDGDQAVSGFITPGNSRAPSTGLNTWSDTTGNCSGLAGESGTNGCNDD